MSGKLLDFIIAGKHSFNIAEESYFKKFVECLNPKFDIPCEKTIRTSLLEKRYDEVVKKLTEIIKLLSSGQTISLTTDGWTSRDRLRSKYNSLTMSFFDKDAKKRLTYALGISPSTVSQTSEFLLSEIVKILERYEMQEKNFKFVLTTDTANVMKGIPKIVIYYFTYDFKIFNYFNIKRLKN